MIEALANNPELIEICLNDEQPSGRFSLGQAQVHLWQLSDEELVGALEHLSGWLSPDELARAIMFRSKWDRDRFIARHGLLRRLLSSYLACKPDEVVLKTTSFGKPFLAESAIPDLSFNISYTAGLTLLAFSREPATGVDVERVNDGIDIFGTGQLVFSKDEIKLLYACAPGARKQLFFQLWARKEAVLKALGIGLGGVPNLVTLLEVTEPPVHWRITIDKNLDQRQWTIINLPLGHLWSAALAVACPEVHLNIARCVFTETPEPKKDACAEAFYEVFSKAPFEGAF